jgi:hypothetical protein
MFSNIVPHIHPNSLVICDLDDTFFTRKSPTKLNDPDGFAKLYEHVNGKIIFLTYHKSKKEIRDKFKEVSLESSQFPILYTTVPKGIFLKDYTYPKNTVFIDNSVRQNNSVKKYCPDIQCFLFR